MQSLERILYVEDEPDIQQVASLALETVGDYTLRICSSGQEALTVIEEFKPQLLLLDVMMPEMDGPGTLLEIRKIPAHKTTPAIFMTAKVRPNEVQQYLDVGAAAVITKPFDPMTLAEQIREVWERLQN